MLASGGTSQSPTQSDTGKVYWPFSKVPFLPCFPKLWVPGVVQCGCEGVGGPRLRAGPRGAYGGWFAEPKSKKKWSNFIRAVLAEGRGFARGKQGLAVAQVVKIRKWRGETYMGDFLGCRWTN